MTAYLTIHPTLTELIAAYRVGDPQRLAAALKAYAKHAEVPEADAWALAESIAQFPTN